MPDISIVGVATDDTGHLNQQAKRMMDVDPGNYVQPFIDPNVYRKPEYFVYVYSIVDPRPAGAKLNRHLPPLVPNMEIAELKPGEEWTLVTTIPHPVNQQEINPDSGQRTASFHMAERVAMDIVNPGNHSLDQDAKITVTATSSIGDDYGKLGVFWSKNYPPTKQEIAAAVLRKETYYRFRLQQARVLESSSPKDLQEWLSADDHVAAEYFGEEFSWHRKATKPVNCPNCSEPIRSLSIAYHASTAMPGTICILDWQKTVEAGVKTKADVPESKRWWGKKGQSENDIPHA